MQVRRLLPALAITLVALAGCEDREARDAIAALTAQHATLNTEFQAIVDWLGKSPQSVKKGDYNVSTWHVMVFKAICNLEAKANPPAADRLCHAADTDHGSPPAPPPWL